MREITAVLAHEMSHIRNNDLWIMSLADLMTRLVQTLSYVALTLALLNIFAALNADPVISWSAILLLYAAPAISSLLLILPRARVRRRPRGGDAHGRSAGARSAPRRLERSTGHFWEDLMFPVPGRRVPVPSLLRTHPSTEDRIRRLLALGATALRRSRSSRSRWSRSSAGADRDAPALSLARRLVPEAALGMITRWLRGGSFRVSSAHDERQP